VQSGAFCISGDTVRASVFPPTHCDRAGPPGGRPASRSRRKDADEDIAALLLLRHDYHGEWDQTLEPGRHD